MKNNTDFVSILIPCYNEEDYIAGCLDSILKNDYPDDSMEIFVIDGMSEDETQTLVRGYEEKYPFVKLLLNEHQIVPYALNKGLKEAKGDYIIRMDAHSEYPENYISTLISYQKKLNADNIGASWDITPADNSLIARANAWSTASPFGVGNALYRLQSNEVKQVDTVPFGCYKRDVFDRIGNFDHDLKRNQDDEFNARLIQNGGKIYLLPFLQIKYTARRTLGKLMKMFYQYALYKPLVNKKLKHPATIRQFAPPLFVLYVLLLCISIIIGFYPLLVSLPMMFYLALSIVFSIKSGLENKDIASIFILPFVFFCIHMSYGIGYVAGLLKWNI
jgi:glycosyltransferase involved in cell wall biosynthesis